MHLYLAFLPLGKRREDDIWRGGPPCTRKLHRTRQETWTTMLVVRDTMLAEGRNSRASSGLPKKIGTGWDRERVFRELGEENMVAREWRATWGKEEWQASCRSWRRKVVSEGRKSTRGLFQVSLRDTPLVHFHFLCSSSSVFATRASLV